VPPQASHLNSASSEASLISLKLVLIQSLLAGWPPRHPRLIESVADPLLRQFNKNEQVTQRR
jgi:hypothetical protein